MIRTWKAFSLLDDYQYPPVTLTRFTNGRIREGSMEKSICHTLCLYDEMATSLRTYAEYAAAQRCVRIYTVAVFNLQWIRVAKSRLVPMYKKSETFFSLSKDWNKPSPYFLCKRQWCTHECRRDQFSEIEQDLILWPAKLVQTLKREGANRWGEKSRQALNWFAPHRFPELSCFGRSAGLRWATSTLRTENAYVLRNDVWSFILSALFFWLSSE